MEFKGKVAVVTGGGSGIGQATVLALAAAGARVIVADINEAAAAATAERAGPLAKGLRVDVTSVTDVQAMIAAALAAGGLDVAVNCAGIDQPPTPFEQLEVELFERVMKVNTFGVWLCMRHQLGEMLQRGRGAIVNVASVTGLVGSAGVSSYCASKHAVVGLTKAAALEVATRGVRVNAICPGGTLTPMLEELCAKDVKFRQFVDAGAKAHPMARMAGPAEIADSILYLASERASFITGTALPVDGGYTAP